MPKTLAVLLVEDSPNDALLIERHLQKGGLAPEIKRVEDPESMVSALRERDWDIIICDHNMPHFSAPEALIVLQASRLDIPFIIVSGTIDTHLAVEAMKAGAQDFIEKDNLARLNPAVEREVHEAADRRRRRDAEKALRDRQERIGFVLDQLPAVLWTTDKDLIFTSYAVSGIKQLGFDPEDMVGTSVGGSPITHFSDPPSVKLAREMHKRAISGQAVEYLAEGGDRTWQTYVGPFRDENDQINGTIAIALDVTEEQRKDQAIRESDRQLRHLSAQLLVAQERERQRLAREIHDSIGQSLAAIKIRTQNIMRRIETNAPRTPATSFEAVLPVIQQTIDEVRRMQADLHPPILDDFGIRAAVKSFIKGFRITYPDIAVTTKLPVSESEVPSGLRAAIFRVVQEALNNVAKHSGGDTVCVCLYRQGDELQLEISDNGRGFNVAKARSEAVFAGRLGLVSMQERVQLSGGTFEVRSGSGTGTSILAAWPLESSQ